MESINKTIENALHFIAVIQDNCERNRSVMEQFNLKCYNTYLKEWKIEQREVKKAVQKSQEVNNYVIKEEKQAKVVTEELEELMLTDLLLEKARSIRSKRMVFHKKRESETTSLPQTESFYNDIIKSDVIISSERKDLSDILKAKKNNHPILLRSKSAMTSLPIKASQISYSTSYNETILKKDINFTKVTDCTNLKKITSRETSSLHKDSSPNDLGLNVISNEKLNELKTICVNHELQKSCQNKIVQNGKDHRSDSPQNAIHHPFFSYQSFKNGLKNASSLKHSFQFKKDRFWYPYINIKNKTYLSEQTKCNTFESVLKVIKLIHKIQEMMFWIDLMSLIGKEVLPSLKFLDQNDKNVARLCSYLSSMYRENLQRLAILNQD